MDLVADEFAIDPAEVRRRNFIPYDRIIVQHGDTAITPIGQGAVGNRGLAIGGAAVVRATARVRDKARRSAAHMLEAAPDDVGLDPEASRYDVRGVPARSLTLAQIADRA